MKVLQNFPMIAETTPKSLVSSFITPNSEFFIRAHQATPPRADPNKFKLKVFNNLSSAKVEKDEDEEDTPIMKLRLSDLKTKYTPHTVMTAMSCAGNRRLVMKEQNPDV